MNEKSSPLKQGRKNTVLLLSNADSGLGNVVLAVCHSLLAEHSDLDVHYGTFPAFKKTLEDINKFVSVDAESSNSKAGSVTIHMLDGPDYRQGIYERLGTIESMLHPPGLVGVNQFCKIIKNVGLVWKNEDYFEIYKQVLALIEEVDPAVVVIEPLFGPGLDAVETSKRRKVIVSPNALQDSFSKDQPLLKVFWKYPALATGYKYPLPLHLIPANIYYILKIAFTVAREPRIAALHKFLKENGVEKPRTFSNILNKDTLWISASSFDTQFPMKPSALPTNVLPCGPIYLCSAPATQQDPELAAWLKNAPTILINLGSHMSYTEDNARAIAHSLKEAVFPKSIQVLWKFKKQGDYSDEFLSVVSEELASDRLRLTKWITAEPTALLETGDIVLCVHHGGANSFHESVATGVSQLILPMWADLYDFATRAEYLGIGVRGNPKSAPRWTSEELTTAFQRVLGDGEEAKAIRSKAADLAEVHRKVPGKTRAAKAIADIVRL